MQPKQTKQSKGRGEIPKTCSHYIASLAVTCGSKAQIQCTTSWTPQNWTNGYIVRTIQVNAFGQVGNNSRQGDKLGTFANLKTHTILCVTPCTLRSVARLQWEEAGVVRWRRCNTHIVDPGDKTHIKRVEMTVWNNVLRWCRATEVVSWRPSTQESHTDNSWYIRISDTPDSINNTPVGQQVRSENIQGIRVIFNVPHTCRQSTHTAWLLVSRHLSRTSSKTHNRRHRYVWLNTLHRPTCSDQSTALSYTGWEGPLEVGCRTTLCNHTTRGR